MPVDGPAGRADWGRIALLHAAASPCIRFMFNARHTRAHSPRAWSRPRTLKRRKPSACLIQPLGASDRSPAPSGVASLLAWDVHLAGDWILIYEITDELLILRRTGTHADLFQS